MAELRKFHVQMGEKHVLNGIPFIPCECNLKGKERLVKKKRDVFTNMRIKRYLDKVDVEVDGLLPHTDVVGNDVSHKMVLGPPRIGLLLSDVTDMEFKTDSSCSLCAFAPEDVFLPFQGSCGLNF